MTRIADRLAAESESIAKLADLRAQVRAAELPPARFAVAWIGSGRKGDSGGVTGEWRVLIDDEVDGVLPDRIAFLARIDTESGVAHVDRGETLTGEPRAAYLEWMRGWYG